MSSSSFASSSSSSSSARASSTSRVADASALRRRASPARRRRGAATTRCKVGVRGPSSKTSDDTQTAGAVTSRRALLAGKALFTVGEAFVFPWATEGATRPKYLDGPDLAPFSPAWLQSILYVPTDPDAKARAKAALTRGEALASEGKHADAIAAFESVYAVAPTEYKMCQRAGLDIAKSYKAQSVRLGDEFDKKANDAKGVVWWWGRGTRWPGWYIIAYLSARNVYFTARDDEVGAFSVAEALGFLVPIWFGLLYVLVQFGIPDY